MALPIISGVVRAAVQGTVPSGQKWANVWHFRYTGGASSPGAGDITALDALFIRMYTGAIFTGGTAWLQNCVAATAIAKISYVVLDGSALGVDIAHVAAGVATGNSTPSECAPVLTLRSTQRGRSHRGRVYLPCPSASSMSVDGRLQSSVAASTVAQLAGLKTALGGPTVSPFWELGIASYKLSVFTPLNVGTMDLDVDVQRHRKN